MSRDSLEGSIQNLLSVLYPPFEATAPTLLSQLFQLIDSRYKGDALRCLLDFLVPAKHILDTVQQAACAQYSEVLFLCEGWPLCLRDQVVIHLASIDPQLLQPGDFYIQVAPFCYQSARILVCSLLEEEDLVPKVVEETPIPETSYPCIFSLDWLNEINHGRHGTPLSQCLLATEQGVVRLPWERVAVPNFVATPLNSSMASAPTPNLSSPAPPLPSKEVKKYPTATPNVPVLSPSSNTTSYSVKTRICPAKHGIAVSICLVDATAVSSSKPLQGKETEKEARSLSSMFPKKWDSPFTTTNPNTGPYLSTAIDQCNPVASNTANFSGESKLIAENREQALKDLSVLIADRSEPIGHAVAEGEYIDVLQATMLFGRAHSLAEAPKSQILHPQTEVQMQKFPQRPGLIQSNTQMQLHRPAEQQPGIHNLPPAQPQALMQLPPSPKSQRCLRSVVASQANRSAQPGSAQLGSPTSHQHSHTQQPFPDAGEPSICVRTVRFSEKPCTPCSSRRQGGTFGRAQELRCRYRDSYQAAIQHPVSVRQDKERAIIAVLEEGRDGGFSHTRAIFENTKRDAPETKWDPVMQKQDFASVDGSICQESGEKNTFPYWKLGDSSSAPCMDYKGVNAVPLSKSAKRTTMQFNEPLEGLSAKPFGHSDNRNRANSDLNTLTNPPVLLSRLKGSQVSEVSTKPNGLTVCQRKDSVEQVTTKSLGNIQKETSLACENFSKSSATKENPHSCVLEGRCSSLSTAVVNTSEKCELVLVEGQHVRRKDSAGSEVPQLHVVKCKNSTAFRLVSPKTSRKKMLIPDAAQPSSISIANRKEYQVESQSHTDQHQDGKEKDVPKSASTRQRPDHLPLRSADPRAHPLYHGVASLTGCRDKTGRAIVELYGGHQGWRSAVTSQQLFQMLLYFHSITRKEIRNAGLTLIFEAKKRNPQPELYKAMMSLHELNPQAVNSLVLLVDKESNNRPQKCPGIKTDVVTSLKALFKLVEANQLSPRLGGGLSHSYCDWMELHQKLFPFVCDLHEVSNLLLRAISKLEEPQRTDTVQKVQQCIKDQRTLMKDVLEDHRLVSLQREGGAILARLRKESDLKYPHCEDLSDAVDSVSSLYNHVEELAHVLVQRSNVLLEHMEYLLQLKEMEEHFIQIQLWFNTEGERHLQEVESVEHSGERLEQILNSFTGFLIEANDRRHHALSLVTEAQQLMQSGPSYPETGVFRALVSTFQSCMEDFLSRAEASGRELQLMVNVCDFSEQATALAKECNDYLDQRQKNRDSSQNPDPTDPDRSILQSFQDRFLHFSPERFQEVKTQAGALKGTRGMQLWNVAWLKCQEARQQLQERMKVVNLPPSEPSNRQERHYVDVISTDVQTASPGGQTLVVQSKLGPQPPLWGDTVSGAVDLEKRRPILGTNAPNITTATSSNINVKPEERSEAKTKRGSNVIPPSPQRPTQKSERQSRRRQTNRTRSERDAAAMSQSHTVGCQWFPWKRNLVSRSMSQDSGSKGGVTAGSTTPPEQQSRPSSSCSHHGQPSCRILQEAQRFQISRHGSFSLQDLCLSDQGAAGHCSLPVRRYELPLGSQSPHQSANNAVRLQRVMEELVFTEREYVRSLGYILTHYFPLMDRLDIPQELRGKRGIIFGNLEKLYNFHSHYFLPELEACQRDPAMVARCFLRHSESFGLYALYSKNKPRSDGLILHCRHDLFKRKQQELGDMMDLSSYLLRPIQRISKYSLLLQDTLALSGSLRPADLQDSLLTSSVCDSSAHVPDLTGSEREREKAEIQAAADLVRFQMRHGNDLLTMDAIQDCDVNLKEQGQLVRQDEFTVFFRKKKCIRRVFLFEDLIIFSKTKKTDVGNDVYIYKQSFKTSDIGMTHNSIMSSLCFEIWFRRRKSEDTYTLKASSIELKKAWTNDLERILWDQASHSRELRMQERVFLGIDHKPFMDLQHSDAAICDRAVSGVLPGRIPVACCSHRGLDYPRPHSIGSGSTASTTLSQSSSSSGRGSLPPAGFPSSQSQGMDVTPGVCFSPETVTDNEINSRFCQHQSYEQWKSLHSMLDSTESSVACTNAFSSSEHSCLSTISAEEVDDSSSVSQGSKPYSSLCWSPSLRMKGSPALGRKKLGVATKAPHYTNALGKGDEFMIGKSTEV